MFKLDKWSFFFIVLISIFSCTSVSAQNLQVTGVRDLPSQIIQAGEIYHTSISINVDESNKPNGFILVETLPSGWVPNNENPTRSSFDAASGQLKWLFSEGIALSVEDVVIEYDVTVLEDVTPQTYSIFGVLKYNDGSGNPIENIISGESSVIIGSESTLTPTPTTPSPTPTTPIPTSTPTDTKNCFGFFLD